MPAGCPGAPSVTEKLSTFDSQESQAEETDELPLKAGEQNVENTIAGNLWQIAAQAGGRVRAGEVIMILESMKMEIPLTAPCDGVIQQINVQPGSAVRASQRVAVI